MGDETPELPLPLPEPTTAASTPKPKRPTCGKCKRAISVCLCRALPPEPLETRTHIFILQHPVETKSSKNTVFLIQLALKYVDVFVTRHLHSLPSHVCELMKQPNALLLYPGDGAIEPNILAEQFDSLSLNSPPQPNSQPEEQQLSHHTTQSTESLCHATDSDLREHETGNIIDTTVSNSSIFNLFVLDGTWYQTDRLLRFNPELKALRRVAFAKPPLSEYRIRKEIPNGLSTCEAVAFCVSALDQNPSIVDAVLKPFRLLVDIQVGHGQLSKVRKLKPKQKKVGTRQKEDNSQHLPIPETDTHQSPTKQTSNCETTTTSEPISTTTTPSQEEKAHDGARTTE
ncbi:DTW domain [Pelomyxa schiedti]|nr:DTW domain [Pelomyxa schiedti]